MGPIAEHPQENLEEELRSGGPRSPRTETDRSPVPIVDPKRSLARFFAALDRTARHEPSAVTRIVFFGDSMVASDFGTGTLRRLLDARFRGRGDTASC